ncbi:MAG: type I-E CRISPR-associated protein Cse2/CasB [Anaerolineaceae bacterium]|nr:type I-E CRISPR-associated protein Cse2/CasB [Brevefilum sp.]
MTDEIQIHPYIQYLYSLAIPERRGALADLRRGIAEPPGTAPVMFSYIARWVPEEIRYSWAEKVYYLIAALFAYYQSGSGVESKMRITKGNFGDHCRFANIKEKQSASFEARFSTILKANVEDLPVVLRQMISLLKSADVPINWDQLFHDLRHWNSESQYVQRKWANSYWSSQKSDHEKNQSD